MSRPNHDPIRAAMADILDYPDAGLCGLVEDTIARLSTASAERSAEALREFLGEVRSLPLPHLQELYCAAFDFLPGCSLHAGWHLFGADPRRGLFLAGLVERYRAQGFSSGRELPDHLPVMLRFASAPAAGAEEIVADAIVPALRAIRRELDRLAQPYRHAVAAALASLRAEGETSRVEIPP
jgi:nitrate reductase molybdenum cofactor assembly chaperone NarJ/NarW